jgi:hypothetical protein
VVLAMDALLGGVSEEKVVEETEVTATDVVNVGIELLKRLLLVVREAKEDI